MHFLLNRLDAEICCWHESWIKKITCQEILFKELLEGRTTQNGEQDIDKNRQVRGAVQQ